MERGAGSRQTIQHSAGDGGLAFVTQKMCDDTFVVYYWMGSLEDVAKRRNTKLG